MTRVKLWFLGVCASAVLGMDQNCTPPGPYFKVMQCNVAKDCNFYSMALEWTCLKETDSHNFGRCAPTHCIKNKCVPIGNVCKEGAFFGLCISGKSNQLCKYSNYPITLANSGGQIRNKRNANGYNFNTYNEENYEDKTSRGEDYWDWDSPREDPWQQDDYSQEEYVAPPGENKEPAKLNNNKPSPQDLINAHQSANRAFIKRHHKSKKGSNSKRKSRINQKSTEEAD